MTADQLLDEREPHLKKMAAAMAERMRRPDLVNDLQQWARIGLWHNAARAPQDPLHRAKWCSDVIRTAMIDGLRREFGRSDSRRAQAVHVEFEEPHEAATPCQAVALLAVRELIARLAELPPRQAALAIGLAEGREQREIQAALGVSGITSWKDRKALRAWVARQLGV